MPKVKEKGFVEDKSNSKPRKLPKRGKKPPHIEDEREDHDTYVRGHNDIKWVNYNTNLARAVSRLPFGKPIGYAMPAKAVTFDADGHVTTIGEQKWSIPGIVTVKGVFTLGRARDLTDPINQAALAIWVYLRHAGTGSLVDDPNDVALYILSMTQVLAYLGWIRRIVAELTAVNPLNLYTRKALITSEGLDYDDIRAHYSDLVAYATWFAMQCNNFIVPKLYVFENAYSQFHYLFKDDAISKGQYYKYAPFQFGIYDELHSESGAGVVYKWIDVDDNYVVSDDIFNDMAVYRALTFEGLKRLGDAILTPLINSQSTATLGAAILKAYGVDKVFRVSDIDMLDERLDVVMDAEIQMQFHNLCWNPDNSGIAYESYQPAPDSGESPYLTTLDGQYMQTIDTIVKSGSIRAFENLLDLFTDDPSEAEVLLGSRHIGAKKFISDDDAFVREWVSTDAFYASRIDVFYYNYANELKFFTLLTDLDIHASNLTPSETADLGNIQSFTGAPFLQLPVKQGPVCLFGTIHNMRTVDVDILSDIYRNNLISLLEVPMFK